tara:strand:- start:24 stop:857 length:834 start_codon:yes stop_codon:yes gene_type:complete
MNTKNIYRSIVGFDNPNIIKNSQPTIYKKFCFLANVFIPKLPFRCPSWMPLLIKKTIFGGNSQLITDNSFNENKNSKEYFLFVNGILTNREIVEKNIKMLKTMFNRPIHCVFNNTDSFFFDIIESMIGKETNDLTEASFITLSSISKILLDDNIDKLIIICHSQGTIIVSQVMRHLHYFGLDKERYLKKIEIYAFANCSSQMKYVVHDYPFMEHFANEHDFVSKMGCNHSKDIKHLIHIDGKIYINNGAFGHYLYPHYLYNFKKNYPNSNLNKYLNL